MSDEIDIQDMSLSDLTLEYNKILDTGKFEHVETYIIKGCQFFLEKHNFKRLFEFCELFVNKKKFKQIISFYKVIALIEQNNLNTSSILDFRNSYIDTTRKSELSLYEKALGRVVKVTSEMHELVKNELSLVRFFKDVSLFDKHASSNFINKSFEVESSWLVKQAILFHKDPCVMNHICLALIHKGDISNGKKLYAVLVRKKFILDERVKFFASKLEWNLSQFFRTQLDEPDKTEVLNFQNRQLPIEAMLKNIDYSDLAPNREDIISSYESNQENDSNKKLAKLFCQALQTQNQELKVSFLIENQFFELAIELIDSELKSINSLETQVALNWYYLALFTSNAKKDYNKTIEYLQTFEHYFNKVSPEQNLEIHYIIAEAYYFLEEYYEAKKYFQKVSKINSNYRITKVRLEEINRF